MFSKSSVKNFSFKQRLYKLRDGLCFMLKIRLKSVKDLKSVLKDFWNKFAKNVYIFIQHFGIGIGDKN